MASEVQAWRRLRPREEGRAAALACFGVLLASYAVNAMDRQIFPLLVPEVRREYGFSLAAVGLLSTVFTLGMAVAGLPTTYLLARFSRKTVLQAGIALFSTGTALTAVSTGFADMLAYRAVTGIGEAMQLTILLAIAAHYFVRYRAAAVGSINFFFALGASVGPMLGGVLLNAYGSWRVPMVVYGVIGFAAIAVIAIAVPPWFSEIQRPPQSGIDRDGAASLLNRNTVLLTLMSLIGGLVIYAYLGMYPTFLREGLDYTPAAAGAVMGIYGMGALASIAGGWLGDRYPPRVVLCASFVFAAALGHLLFNGPDSFLAQATLSFLWGIVVSGVVYVNLAGCHVKALKSHLAGHASGIFVTSLYGSASAAGYLMGWIAGRAGWAAAGDIQITALSLVAGGLAAALKFPR